MSPEERELFEAQKQYDDAVDKAERTLDITEQTWHKRVKAAEQALTEARSIGTRAIGAYRKVKIFEDHVETSSGTFRFENGRVEATVDTAPSLLASKQAALSRAGQEIMRRLTTSTEKPEQAKVPYLLIETPVFVDVTEGKADDESKLRQLALSMNNASGSMDRIAQQRAHAVAQAEESLEATRTEAERAVEAARHELEAVKASDSRLEAAKAALQRAQQTEVSAAAAEADQETSPSPEPEAETGPSTSATETPPEDEHQKPSSN